MPDATPAHTPHTVFVSHAHADNALADRYVAALRRRRLDVWYDRTNMQDGHFLSEEIERELEQRTAFVVLLSPAALLSYYVKLETDAFRALAAQDRTRLFLPVRMVECKVPALMAGIKWIDAVSLGFDAAIDALAKALRAPGGRSPTLGEPGAMIPLPARSGKQPAVSPSPRGTKYPAIPATPSPLAQGEALLAQDKFAGAIPFLERATQRDPRSFDAWANLGRAYIETGQYGDGLAANDRALALDDTQVWVWNNKGKALNDLRRYDEALAAYERALELDPKYAFAWNGKGNALYRLNRPDEALVAYDRALALDPRYVLALKNKAITLREIGRSAEAEAAERRVRELEREEQKPK